MAGCVSQKEINKQVLEHKLRSWIQNAVDNRALAATRGADITEIRGVLKEEAVLILGPGPSLDLCAPYWSAPEARKDLRVFCCNSALNPIAARKIVPDFVVAYDAGIEPANQVIEYVNYIGADALKECTLICPVTIHPTMPAAWPGQIVWFLLNDPTTPETATFTKSLEALYPDRNGLSNVSCVFTLCVVIAHEMGGCPILSAGFDLPVTMTDSYGAARYDLTKGPPVTLPKQHKDMAREYVVIHRGYAAGVLATIRSIGATFINLSPLASFKDFVITLPPSTILTGLPQEKSDGKD